MAVEAGLFQRGASIAVAEACGYEGDIERTDELYLAAPEAYVGILSMLPDNVTSAMVVGHNPGLTDLVNFLCADYLDNLPTFGVAVLDVGDSDWKDLREDSASLGDLILPKEV